MKKMPNLGEQESLILDHILRFSSLSVREAAIHFEKTSGLARTTVLTVMERLRAKGYLQRSKVDGAFRYSGRVEAGQVLKNKIQDFVERTLGGSVNPFFNYLSESSNLSADELEQLKALIQKIDQKLGGS